MNPENEQNVTTEEEESTIFGASPTKYDDKPVKKGRMLKNIVSLVLAVAVLAGAAFAIIKFIPESDEGTSSIVSEDITVIDLEQKDVKSVTITRAESASTYISTIVEEEGSESGETTEKVEWSIEGIDSSLTETTSISMIMDTALNLSASRKIEKEDGADYGFAAPSYKVNIVGYDAANNVELLVGNETPSASGLYATVDGGETVYLIDSADAQDFATPDEELSTSKIINAPEQTDDNAAYFEEGELVLFDYITLSGKAYSRAMRFENNDDEDMASYVAFLMTEPSRRYADAELVSNLFTVAQNGLTGVCAYVYEPTSADIKTYGLDNPDIVLNIVYGTQTVSLKATKQQDGYFAVTAAGAPNIIFKVAESSLSFAGSTAEDFTGATVFAEMITKLKKIEITTAEKTYVFDIENIVSEEEDKNDILNVYYEGKQLDSENFKNYYQYIVGATLTEVTFDKVSATSEYTVVTTREDGGTATFTLAKQSDRRYYLEVDKAPVGFISTTYFEKLLNYLPLAAGDETVPEMY